MDEGDTFVRLHCQHLAVLCVILCYNDRKTFHLGLTVVVFDQSFLLKAQLLIFRSDNHPPLPLVPEKVLALALAASEAQINISRWQEPCYSIFFSFLFCILLSCFGTKPETNQAIVFIYHLFIPSER